MALRPSSARTEERLAESLRHVAADGTTRGGYQGWFMETALRALNHKDKVSDETRQRRPDLR